jgi:uncharacterized membrane-anchored protein
MSSTKTLVIAALWVAVLGTTSLPAQTSESKSKLKLLTGPATAHLSNVAKIELPPGYFFVDGKDYRTMLKAEGEPTSGNELGFLSNTNRDWSVIFEFSDVGYVKDDDKDSLNADKLLDSIKRGTADANKHRFPNQSLQSPDVPTGSLWSLHSPRLRVSSKSSSVAGAPRPANRPIKGPSKLPPRNQ